MNERKESLMRIVVLIVSGIILGLWAYVIYALVIVNFIVTLFTGKRNKELAEFCESWNTQVYTFVKYMSFLSNERPMPFGPIVRNMNKFRKK